MKRIILLCAVSALLSGCSAGDRYAWSHLFAGHPGASIEDDTRAVAEAREISRDSITDSVNANTARTNAQTQSNAQYWGLKMTPNVY